MKRIVIDKLEVLRRMRGVRTMLMIGALAAGQAFLLLAPYPISARRAYEAYYNYIGNYPRNANTGWNGDPQGLTHDQDDWFIIERKRIWRIPVTQDLKNVGCGGRVVCRSLDDFPALLSERYDHMGDPEYYHFGGKGYVLVPMEGTEDDRLFARGVAAFDATTLEYIAHAPLPGQIHCSWLAVDPQGNVYSSEYKDVTAINKFGLDWAALSNTENPRLILSSPTLIPLFDGDQSQVVIQNVQGGVVSPSGELLYVVADGIHVFDLGSGTRIQLSTNGSGYFNYEFHPEYLGKYEEPEGLTIWDLDDGRAPGIRGQLHAILRDNDHIGANEVYLKHYTNTICVDRNYQGVEAGTEAQPFNTVNEANNWAWDGARVRIKGAPYPERPTFAKRVEVVAHEGSVIIGK